MRTITLKLVFLLCLSILWTTEITAQTKKATIIIDSSVKHQKITGFGGFVNSPQFGYNHMTPAEIKMLWGNESELGLNIMRIYLPIGKSNWPQSLATAQLAQSLGLTIFASPWSMPAEWKTNNSSDGVVTVDGVEKVGYLKEEHYEDYANYLNDYVVYLRDNGVELAGISIQNEPDYKVTYAGCLFTPQQMASFIKDYAHIITCPIIAAEGVGITNNYANALLEDDVFNNLGVFAGHQYGAIQQDHKKFQKRGMEVWMTEFLINWNADNSNRNFIWSVDAFSFAEAINTAMLADINAWIHYASKRYYAMMGDGTYGTQRGVITKRGYILSHFAKYTTGTTRIENIWKDGASVLKGSSYLSVGGDSVIINIINSSNDSYSLTVDLPFKTISGAQITTTENSNMDELSIDLEQESFRPKINIPASSFTTIIFKKSGVRPISEMTGELVNYNVIENMETTNPSFGNNYQLSNKKVVFDHSKSLISSFTNNTNGYLQLDDRYNKLVFHVADISSTMSYTSANTTLYYINKSGSVRSHNYGTVNFNQNGNFNWTLDISSSVLTDGCTGVIGITNGNYSSILTITFGDVYFLLNDEKSYKFSGPYSSGDSNLLDCLEDVSYTSIDFTETTNITSDLEWHSSASNKNCIYYINDDANNNGINVIKEDLCSDLKLYDAGGSFFVPNDFTALSATYTRTLNGFEMLVLPFDATIPEGVRAYHLQLESDEMIGTTISDGHISANIPVLIYGEGTYTFEGSGEVSTPAELVENGMKSVYISIKAPVNSYTVITNNGYTSLQKVSIDSAPILTPFSAYFDFGNVTSDLIIPLRLDDGTYIRDDLKEGVNNKEDGLFYDVLGRKVLQPRKGVIYIHNGEKIIY